MKMHGNFSSWHLYIGEQAFIANMVHKLKMSDSDNVDRVLGSHFKILITVNFEIH